MKLSIKTVSDRTSFHVRSLPQSALSKKIQIMSSFTNEFKEVTKYSTQLKKLQTHKTTICLNK